MSESNHVGPIIFANETARGQLVENGEVVSFRVSDRTTGDTWWRKSRTGSKQGDVHVEQIAEDVDVLDLAEHAELSGFESVEDWQDAIRDVHGEVARQDGYLYRVTDIDESDEFDPSDLWFWCPGCDIEFRDPNAPIRRSDTWGDEALGNCPECGATIEHEVPDDE